MIARQRIQEFADEVARRFHPERIILFGSYAYGTPTEDSDVDLLVVMPHHGCIAKAAEVRQAVHAGFPLDLLVYPEAYIKHRIEIEDFFLREIIERGDMLFEKPKNSLKPLTPEWVDRAEGDWGTLQRVSRTRNSPNHSAVCFHARQCAEEYLKARLQEASVPSPKTRDLCGLLSLVLPVEPAWHVLQPALLKLNDYGIDVLYPGRSATRADAREAKRLCADVREAARRSLGLPVA